MLKKNHAILLVLICTVLLSLGQILMKGGSGTATFNLSLFSNTNLIFGYILYIIAGLLLIIALRYGDLSLLYPIVATSYVWVALLSIYFFNEIVSSLQWLGISSIIIGVVFVGVGGNKNGN